MRGSLAVLALASLAVARNLLPQIKLQPHHESAAQDIPSVHESAVMARRIAQLAAHGDLITNFPPSGSSHEADNEVGMAATPSSVAGDPIGLLEYVADCESGTGNPTLLAVEIATPYRNFEAGSNISLSIRWWPAEKNFYTTKSWWSRTFGKEKKQDIPTPHTPAALPRISLHGRLERIQQRGLDGFYLAQCFVRKHPDSVYWQPNTPGGAHASHYVRFVVEQVYWFGGFGDRARIGWLPIDEWRSVTPREIDEYCRAYLLNVPWLRSDIPVDTSVPQTVTYIVAQRAVDDAHDLHGLLELYDKDQRQPPGIDAYMRHILVQSLEDMHTSELIAHSLH